MKKKNRTGEHLDHGLRERVEEDVAHAEFHVVEKLRAVVGLAVKHDAHRQAANQMMVKLYVQADLLSKRITDNHYIKTLCGNERVFT